MLQNRKKNIISQQYSNHLQTLVNTKPVISNIRKKIFLVHTSQHIQIYFNPPHGKQQVKQKNSYSIRNDKSKKPSTLLFQYKRTAYTINWPVRVQYVFWFYFCRVYLTLFVLETQFDYFQKVFSVFFYISNRSKTLLVLQLN